MLLGSFPCLGIRVFRLLLHIDGWMPLRRLNRSIGTSLVDDPKMFVFNVVRTGSCILKTGNPWIYLPWSDRTIFRNIWDYTVGLLGRMVAPYRFWYSIMYRSVSWPFMRHLRLGRRAKTPRLGSNGPRHRGYSYRGSACTHICNVFSAL